MLHVFTWLSNLINNKNILDIINKIDIHQDAPINVAKQILRASQVCIYITYIYDVLYDKYTKYTSST